MPNLGKLPANSQIDFRVQALFGYYREVMVDWVPPFRPSYSNIFTGESSDWNSIQTITVAERTPTPTPSTTEKALPTQNPTATLPITETDIFSTLDWEKTAIIVLAVMVAVLTVGMAALWRKVPKK
jgi:hypothetical protein